MIGTSVSLFIRRKARHSERWGEKAIVYSGVCPSLDPVIFIGRDCAGNFSLSLYWLELWSLKPMSSQNLKMCPPLESLSRYN